MVLPLAFKKDVFADWSFDWRRLLLQVGARSASEHTQYEYGRCRRDGDGDVDEDPALVVEEAGIADKGDGVGVQEAATE